MIAIQINKKIGGLHIQANIEASPKGVTALYGPSGAGKTSIINMVAGLLRPDRGHIQANGHCLFDSQKGIDLPPEKRRIGYVFQDGRLFPHLSIKSNLTYGMRRVPKEERYVTLEQVIALLGIGHLLHRRPTKLSGGEKQRVAIGRALLASPAVLLMDEPLASLDEHRKAEVLPFIARLADVFAVPILYVTHARDEIMALANTVVMVDHGQITAVGQPDDFMKRVGPQYLKNGNTGYKTDCNHIPGIGYTG